MVGSTTSPRSVFLVKLALSPFVGARTQRVAGPLSFLALVCGDLSRGEMKTLMVLPRTVEITVLCLIARPVEAFFMAFLDWSRHEFSLECSISYPTEAESQAPSSFCPVFCPCCGSFSFGLCRSDWRGHARLEYRTVFSASNAFHKCNKPELRKCGRWLH
jgi:hypothetical protein